MTNPTITMGVTAPNHGTRRQPMLAEAAGADILYAETKATGPARPATVSRPAPRQEDAEDLTRSVLAPRLHRHIRSAMLDAMALAFTLAALAMFVAVLLDD